jgi:hypothetical protein
LKNVLVSVQISLMEKEGKLSSLFNLKKSLMNDLLTGKTRVKCA